MLAQLKRSPPFTILLMLWALLATTAVARSCSSSSQCQCAHGADR